jgi:hypothetical protein
VPNGGYDAVINYDPEIEMFRGEFINLNGGADFYVSDISGLHKEGQLSLNILAIYLYSNVVIDTIEGRDNELMGRLFRSLYLGPYCYPFSA